MTLHQLDLLAHANGSQPSAILDPTTEWWRTVDHCVHIIDDDSRFLDAVGSVLQSLDLQVAPYPSAERYLSTRQSHAADCILLDMRMPEMSGIELLRVMSSDHVRIPVIMLSAYDDTSSVVEAVRSGAMDYLVKPVAERELVEKTAAALRADYRNKLRLADVLQRLQRLSDRERQVMDLFAAAKTTRQVASALGISPKTVEKHRVNIFEKLNVESVPAMIRLLFDADVHPSV